MGDTGGKFRCEACGAAYKWKAELAGKKVKCKCGSVMRVPESIAPDDPAALEIADPPAPPAPPTTRDKSKLDPAGPAKSRIDPASSSPGSYGLSGDTAAGIESPATTPSGCPGCGSPLADAAVICINCGFNLKTGQKLGGASIAGADRTPADESKPPLGGLLAKAMTGGKASDKPISMGDAADNKLWQLKQREIPIALIVAGVAVTVGQAYRIAGEDGIVPALINEAILTGIGLTLLIALVLVMVRLLEMDFGAIHTALLKVIAVYIAPGTLAMIAYDIAGGGLMGLLAGIVVMLLAFYFLFKWLFDLDAFETMTLAGTGWVIRFWLVEYFLRDWLLYGGF